jgi:hypothetical protein
MDFADDSVSLCLNGRTFVNKDGRHLRDRNFWVSMFRWVKKMFKYVTQELRAKSIKVQ